MKRIMTGVILVLAVLAFSSSGVVAKDQLEEKVHIIIKGKKMLKFEVEYDAVGNPLKIIDKDDNTEWTETDRPPITNEIISIFTENPCKVCIGSTCWKRDC